MVRENVGYVMLDLRTAQQTMQQVRVAIVTDHPHKNSVDCSYAELAYVIVEIFVAV